MIPGARRPVDFHGMSMRYFNLYIEGRSTESNYDLLLAHPPNYLAHCSYLSYLRSYQDT